MLQQIVKIFLTCLLLSSIQQSSAQLVDNFSDGDFTANPAWNGTTGQFTVNSSFELQLQASGDGSSWLSTLGPVTGNTEWRFAIRLSFSPSDNNNALVYLASVQQDLSTKPDGLYLKFGEAGSSDAIRLIARQAATDQEICAGPAGQVAVSFDLDVKVIRDESGNFQLFSAPGGQSYSLIGSGTHSYLPSTSWFGWLCKYTSSNATKFYLDDVYAGEPVVDLTPPELTDLAVEGLQSLNLTFSEPLDELSATNVGHYTLTPGNLSPQLATFSETNPAAVTLAFADPFSAGISYTLTVNGVADLALNPCTNEARQFSITNTSQGDVIISEIMADPDPPLGLPNYEYIELHNTTSVAVDLSGWTLTTGSTPRPIAGGVIGPNGYIILCKSEAVPLFTPLGNTAALASLTLTNTGQPLQLLNKEEILIDSVTYAQEWYADPAKDDGGWSLEMITPNATCMGKANWHASMAAVGGSPGAENTVAQFAPGKPLVQSISTGSDNQLTLVFSQPMDNSTVTSISNYSLYDGATTAAPANVTAAGSSTVTLSFETPFTTGVVYRLTISSQVANCLGNHLASDTTLPFGLPQPATIHDLLISEIMADPEPVVGLPAEEYLELYNRTSHSVNLEGWTLQVGSTVKTLPARLMLPGEYLILTSSDNVPLFQSYGGVIAVGSLSLTNDGATLILADGSGNQIHALSYTSDWYGSSAKAGGGWSLELIDPSNPCAGADNWTASRDAAGGTPGKENSVNGPNPDNSLPILLRANYVAPDKAELLFSESTNSATASLVSRYTVSPGEFHPVAATPQPPFFNTVVLQFPGVIEAGVIYTIAVSDSVTDCAGNRLQSLSSARVALPFVPETADVVINELLTNPAGDGKDYLELYNTTEKTIDLAAMGLTYQSATSSDSKTVFLPAGLLFPDGYVLLCQKPDLLYDRYSVQSPGNLTTFGSLPDFSSAGGSIRLHRMENTDLVIDSLSYDEAMHSPLLTSTDGVALERVNPLRPSSDRTNWQSAGAASRYGTPGYRNSQYNANPVAAGELVCEPLVFSPDGDGYNDITSLTLRPDEPGYMVTIGIYDATGRRVAVPVNNQLAGTENTWSWNGITDSGNQAQSGIYIILAELVHPAGKTNKLKTTVVVTRR